jgi:hypothetical protein
MLPRYELGDYLIDALPSICVSPLFRFGELRRRRVAKLPQRAGYIRRQASARVVCRLPVGLHTWFSPPLAVRTSLFCFLERDALPFLAVSRVLAESRAGPGSQYDLPQTEQIGSKSPWRLTQDWVHYAAWNSLRLFRRHYSASIWAFRISPSRTASARFIVAGECQAG